MFREMRRKKQALSKEECDAILERGASGVLAVAGDGDYPYTVPLSYAYDNGKLYFHSAKSGHKIDAIGRNNKASFCVIDKDEIISEEFTTYFRSVIAFGILRILEDDGEKMEAIEKLALRYAPDSTAEDRSREIEKDWRALCLIELEIKHVTGKEAIELVRQKSKSLKLE